MLMEIVVYLFSQRSVKEREKSNMLMDYDISAQINTEKYRMLL